ncbi:MAG: CheB methylesterase domain-containing protein [Roseovarius sp.]|uniref:CheB methylesterase domain-containing protein n=1 Tax=Roseovarius sp. TaxID=1486281 RepID=UPI0032EFC4DF
MPSRRSSCLSVLLLDPRRHRSNRYLLSIAETPEISLIGCARDLTQAYNLTEHEHPDLVLLSEEVTRLGNFPMYAAMLAALEVDCIVIAAGPRAAPGPYAVTNDPEIDRAGGMGPFLAARCGLRPRARLPEPESGPADGWKTVVIGASTGGVEALIRVLSDYPETGPPTLIVQHISANFLPGLAQRLDRHCAATVRPAGLTDVLAPGLVLLAPGNDRHLSLISPGRRCRLSPGAPVSGHRPSVDVLFHSAAALGSAAVGVLLTGMGRDGAEGLAAMRRAGSWTIGQDEASSTVYGMPRAAFDIGAVAQQLPISRVGSALLSAAAQTTERSRHG